MFTKIEDLSYEIDGDTITLEQDGGCGEVDRIQLHRLHLRHLAGLAGLLQAPSPSTEALARRMRVLRGRIDHLADWLTNKSDHKHADLTYELTYATATADIADEFCEGLDLSPSIELVELEPAQRTGPAQSVLI